jgi:hypothetical protein
MNIFEGTRRIAKVFAVLWIIFCAVMFLYVADLDEYPFRVPMLLLGGLAFIGGFTVATGWIVRGFMGIPRGLDRRPWASTTCSKTAEAVPVAPWEWRHQQTNRNK